jgi:acetyl-CoA acetyltransferase
MTLSDRTAIVGIGETEYRKWGGFPDRSEYRLALEAILAAVADAGLEVRDVDGISSFSSDRNEAVLVASALGLPRLRLAQMSWIPGGGGACAAIGNAAMAIASGVAECVVVYRAINMGQFRRFGRALAAESAKPWDAELSFALPFGLLNATIGMGLLVRRHMHLYGTTTRQLGRVAVTFRAHANRNPRAVMHGKPMTLEDHERSRMIAEPFRLFDCCLETDGACAVVMTSAERAADLRQRPVRVLGATQGAGPGAGLGAWASQYLPDDDYATGWTRTIAEDLWRMAGVGPQAVDVAEIYDHYSGMVILQLEDFGFCARGEGGPFVESGAIEGPAGALPVNTAGGSLSEAYIHGLNHVVEAVKQLRGVSTCQVPDAEVSLVSSGSGIPTSAVLLRR